MQSIFKEPVPIFEVIGTLDPFELLPWGYITCPRFLQHIPQGFSSANVPSKWSDAIHLQISCFVAASFQ